MHSVLNEGGLSNLFAMISGNARATRKSNADKGRVYLKGSISKYTNNLTMSFPMLCDATLPIDTATMISTANEYNIVDMLQKLFSSVSIKGDNGVEILRSYYKGIDNNMSMEDMIEFLDDLVVGESAISDAELRSAIQEMCAELRNPKFFPQESISENSLNDYLVYGNDRYMSIREGKNYNRRKPTAHELYRQRKREEYEDNKNQYTVNKDSREEEDMKYKRNKDFRDAEENNRRRQANDRENEKMKYARAKESRDKEAELRARRKDSREEEKFELDKDRDQRDIESHNGQDYASIKRVQDDINRLNQNRLVAQDVKKQNQLQGTLMVISFVDVVGQGRGQIAKTFVAGVKSRIIPVEAQDIVERLAEKNPGKNGSGLSKFVKFTTGEISLSQMISNAFTQTKLKAKNAAKNKSGIGRMWDILEKRGIANNAAKLRRVSNDASAITGLVISQETANFFKNSYDFDIERVKNAKQIMDAYNLMSIFIADEANEVVKSIYDGNGEYEYASYSSMHKDVADKNYKKIINLLNNQK